MNKKILKIILQSINKIIITAAIILIVFFAAQTAYNYGFNLTNNKGSQNKLVRDVTIKIPKGSTTKDIAKILEKNRLINNALMFRITSKMENYDGKFQYGTYELNTSMSEEKIMQVLLTEGEKRKDIEITIPEGYTVEQIANKLQREKICDADEFIAAANEVNYDYDFIKKIPKRNLKLQGYLFPDTYYLRQGVTAKEIVSKMLAQFNNIFTEEYYNRAEQLGYTVDEIITIASIIEKEAKVDEERPIMAGVIYNRLKKGMPLGMCSTVLYALGKSGQPVRKLYTSETQVDSPYNTYINKGLPIGPISNPGRAAIEAALFPDENNYLYFVLKDSNKGTHYFSKTYEEHIRAKNKYLK